MPRKKKAAKRRRKRRRAAPRILADAAKALLVYVLGGYSVSEPRGQHLVSNLAKALERDRRSRPQAEQDTEDARQVKLF